MSTMSVLGQLAKSRTAPMSSPIGSEKPTVPRHRGSVPNTIVNTIRGASFRPSLVMFSSKPIVPHEDPSTSSIISNPIYDAYKKARLEVLRMEAIWHLLVTGIEVTKYPHQGAARTRVLWLALDGRLCLGKAKGQIDSAKAISLWSIDCLERGCTAPQFNLSLSWRETRGREQTCFSVRGKHAGQSFALQVQSVHVRNVIVDNVNTFLNHMQGDVDGDFPKAIRVRIAQQFAATGEVLSIHEVRAVLHREGSEASKLRHGCPCPNSQTFDSGFESESDSDS
ncbi:hypothetical protein H310_04366 [Aphanomyces invadans]|uniref:Uncharacterized protein n=1 Tax=Aphanomyces invadans TaxID=157072 RepID=A0A024UEC9_9STRA|nr:hypothetical protein H310_04366 [Aphanomyces invadans]ETW03958.1 hypothetical protein H310_04366 [Aphanomyces invadans]|eukprot:XP_008866914.1 hypothetical protein H310_04366 [Aphanomyces invadans]